MDKMDKIDKLIAELKRKDRIQKRSIQDQIQILEVLQAQLDDGENISGAIETFKPTVPNGWVLAHDKARVPNMNEYIIGNDGNPRKLTGVLMGTWGPQWIIKKKSEHKDGGFYPVRFPPDIMDGLKTVAVYRNSFSNKDHHGFYICGDLNCFYLSEFEFVGDELEFWQLPGDKDHE